MKRTNVLILASGLLLAILISNCVGFIRDGRRLDELRGSVLRLHILANSDSEYDQRLKLEVRDELLRSGLFERSHSLKDAEETASAKMDEITALAESVLRRNGCYLPVTCELADTHFDERVYGDITMPEGNYRALRVKIGEARGHNWWCVMYPPLCIPAACPEEVEEDTSAEECFTEEQLDILYKPKKYRVRFVIWDKIKELTDK